MQLSNAEFLRLNDTCLLGQGSLDAMDLGDLEGQDPESLRASLREANGAPAPASANGAANMSGMPRAFKDSELRRLDEEVRPLTLLRTNLVLLHNPFKSTIKEVSPIFGALYLCGHECCGYAGEALIPQTHCCVMQWIIDLQYLQAS